LDWCLAHPPAEGCTSFDDTCSFTVTSGIRTGENLGAQLVLTDTGLVAKIYDPLFYSFQDQDFQDLEVDVATAADSEYSIEAAAYSELQGTSVEGCITPEYNGSWTLNVTGDIQDEHITRQVRLVLVEYVPGVRMADFEPHSLTPEVRRDIMVKVIEADYDIRRAGVRHDDISPRNIIFSKRPNTANRNFRIRLVDFGHSTVFKIRFGRPLR
ncbi:hypothetical protein BU25DRAFT_349111, partial [Macroventuria anomochaeta]